MRLVILSMAWAWACVWAVAGFAQVPLSKPDTPLLTNGTVRAVVAMPDGSVIIGGNFSHVNSAPRANLAKLAPDGSLDEDWTPQTNDQVHALARDDFGNVIVGGNFTEVNGQSRLFLVKISGSGSGTLDPVWNPQVFGSVNTVIVDGNGDVTFGGIFTQVASQTRLRIAKVSGTGVGALDPNWNPSADGVVTVLALGPGGSVLVAGGFENIGGQPRQKLAKVAGLGTGQADPTWNPGVDDRIEAMATDSSGNVYVAGYFTTIGGQPRSNVARLSGSGTGAADPSWIPSVGGYTSDLRIGPDGMIYVVGDFIVVNSRLVGGMARLSPTNAAIDDSWRPLGADSSVLAIDFAPDGDAVIGGAFSSIEGQEAAGYVRIDDAANVVDAASTDMPGFVRTALRQRDGGLVVGGRFWKAGSVRRNNVARFQRDGDLDPDWNPSIEGDFAFVYALAEDAAGRVYIGGSYDTVEGLARRNLVRYAWSGGVGTLDPTWNPQPDGPVISLATANDGSVYVGGDFAEIGGQPRARIAKLSGDGGGSAVTGWEGSANERVLALALAPSGDVYAGGVFTSIGGENIPYLARLSGATGVADPIWAPTPDNWVYDIAVGAGDAVYAAGLFEQVGLVTRNHLARIVAAGSGTPYAAWNPNADRLVWTLAIDDEDNVYVGGDFDNVGGAARRGIAKLSGLSSGQADPQWNPSIEGGTASRVFDFVTRPDRLDVVGDFTSTGGRERVGLARFSTREGFIFSDGFE